MITSKSIRIFFISLALVFLMVVIPHLTVKQTWVSPPPHFKQKDIFKEIEPKLRLKPHDFNLKTSLIPPVSAGSDYDQAQAYGVVDFETGEVLASKNLSDKMPMASLTKIMTAVVSLDLANPQEEFTVSQKAASTPPTKVMLKTGEKYSLNDLLSFLLITSANDSAQVIKEGIDQKYGQEVFIKAMNKKAQVIGLKNSSFTNPQGFDSENHYSSVEDLSLLSHYAMKNYPLITQIVGQDHQDLTYGWSDLRFYLNNWNGLLGLYPGVFGIKIGNTGKAGNCAIVLSERENEKVLVTLLGAPGVLERDFWTAELLDLGFGKLAGLSSVNITEDQLRAKYASWKYFE
ncbi:D-alanyl-D-alanine carboxypeptidase [Candidatus Daviesbacteria bacterium]|nr:D-alanyl-D-alanine carboxypeptidase [Candidatus Daviesbacteria bacterium]